MRIAIVGFVAVGAVLAGLGACSKRDAEVQTANTQVEVSTKAPESVVSDEKLNDQAVNAALAADPNSAPYIKEGAGGTTALPPVNQTGPVAR